MRTLTHWLSLLETRHTLEIQLGLDRIKAVAQRLGVLPFECPVITIGGTNGKGTTVATLESIYTQAGYLVGSYTSPHLIHFNERIRINQQAISDQDLINWFTLIEEARQSIDLTYFETVTLAALCHFKRQPLDLILLEVGLGGRLDAVNCVDTDLAIITTVDFDHEDYLGHTLEAIGFEKAGIIRPYKPVIYADTTPTQSILKKTSDCQATLFINGKDYSYQYHENGLNFFYKTTQLSVPNAVYHPNSIAAALMATCCLQQQLPLPIKAYDEGIKKINLPGRFQLIHYPHPTLLDVTHNPQAAQYLADFLKRNYPSTRLHIVFSALDDKDLINMVRPFKKIVKQWYPTLLSGKRAATEKQVLEAFQANDIDISLCYTKPISAYRAACMQANKHDLIVVFGSFILVGAILSALNDKTDLSHYQRSGV